MNRVIFYFFFGVYGVSFAQADNNSISNRKKLIVGEVVHSSTWQNDVEWDCINQALTSKCLVYHNDQWFSFNVPSSKRHYLNIYNQNCRDKLGVQLLVIEGDPCKTNLYKVLKCISTTDYGNFNLALDSLKPGYEYLLNVDGYLADQCKFNIELSTFPKGVSITADFKNKVVEREVGLDSVIVIDWLMNESLQQCNGFEIYRRKDKGQTVLFRNIPIRRNAYGEAAQQYFVYDTLHHDGFYTYLIFSIADSTQVPLKKEVIHFKKKTVPRRNEIVFNLPRTGQVFIYVFDGSSGKPLEARHEFMHEGNNRLLLDLAKHQKDGAKAFKVVIRAKDFEEVFTF